MEVGWWGGWMGLGLMCGVGLVDGWLKDHSMS